MSVLPLDRITRGCPGVEPRFLVEGQPKPCAFLDRDGVLNEEIGYLHNVDQFVWTEDALKAIRWLKSSDWWVVVITNQSAIGRNLYTEHDFKTLSLWMLDKTEIDLICYCPHAPEEECPARKPGISMFETASRVLPIDKSLSFMIGDRDKDIEAANAFGIKSARYSGGSLLQLVESTSRV